MKMASGTTTPAVYASFAIPANSGTQLVNTARTKKAAPTPDA